MAIREYSALIIGCGSIGALKDDKYDAPKSENILTWAHAFYNHPQITKIAFLDIDKEKVNRTVQKWGGLGYTRLTPALINTKPDIIVVSVATNNHFQILLDIVKSPDTTPKIVIAEKPFTSNLFQAQIISELYQKLNIPLIINYNRRYDSFVLEFKNQIDIGMFGLINSCTVTYERGFVRDACHGLDLMRFFFGKYKKGHILNYDDPIIDYSDKDPTYAAYLSFEKCKNVFFIPVDGGAYSLFEIDVLTEKGRFQFVDHGKILRTYKVISEQTYGDHSTLANDHYTEHKTGLISSLETVLQTAINKMEKDIDLPIKSKEAVEIHKIYKDLFDKKDNI